MPLKLLRTSKNFILINKIKLWSNTRTRCWRCRSANAPKLAASSTPTPTTLTHVTFQHVSPVYRHSKVLYEYVSNLNNKNAAVYTVYDILCTWLTVQFNIYHLMARIIHKSMPKTEYLRGCPIFFLSRSDWNNTRSIRINECRKCLNFKSCN